MRGLTSLISVDERCEIYSSALRILVNNCLLVNSKGLYNYFYGNFFKVGQPLYKLATFTLQI